MNDLILLATAIISLVLLHHLPDKNLEDEHEVQ